MSIVYVGQACSNEKGGINGGQKGDQNGREVRIEPWYEKGNDFSWTCVLRCPDRQKAKNMAHLMRMTCLNDNIGYDQNDRYGYYILMKQNNWDPSKINVPCHTDCSQLISTLCISQGYNISRFTYTGSLRNQLVAVGFNALTYSRFLTSPDYLQEGDILLAEGKHTCMVLDDGAKADINAGNDPQAPKTTVDFYGVPTANLFMRTGAGKEYGVVMVMSKGTKVDILDSKTIADGTVWYYVKCSGKFGWCSSKFIEKVEEAEKVFAQFVGKCTAWTNVYTSTSKTSAKVQEWNNLSVGNLVDVIGQKDAWYMIRIANKYVGWVPQNVIVNNDK